MMVGRETKKTGDKKDKKDALSILLTSVKMKIGATFTGSANRVMEPK